VLFNTIQFAVFLCGVLSLYYAAPRFVRNGNKARSAVLLGASLVFYTMWIPAYLLLLLLDVVVNYGLLRAMLVSNRPRLHLVASCVFTLGLLAYYKYAAMLLETALPVLEGGFGFSPEVPEIFLPLGISFYSFQILALTIDCYRDKVRPPVDGPGVRVPTFARYTLFVSFFPQLIAGPILRGHEFLPQLERGGETTRDRTRRGLWLIGVGLGKKVILADFLLPPVSSFHWLALYSFAFQIYYDFSGYCDMARGMALLLGYELPLNFMEPYLSRDPREFWRRWHVTLSRWLSDYLYIPLGGSRRGHLRTYGCLMATMLLGGLWHGASWNFVVWGGLHGLLLLGHRLVGRRPVDLGADIGWRDGPRIFLLFNAVSLTWVFFRAPTFERAMAYFGALFSGYDPYGWPHIQLAIVLFCVALHFVERSVRRRLPRLRQALDERWWGGALEGAALGTIVGLAVMLSGVGGDFIYFQF